MGGDEVVERIDGGGEEHGVAALAGLVAQGDGEVGLAGAARPEEGDAGLLLDEAQPEQVFDLHFVDLGRPVPAESVQGLEDGEAGGVDAPLQGSLLPALVFAFEQALEIVGVGQPFFRRLLGERLVIFGDIRRGGGNRDRWRWDS